LGSGTQVFETRGDAIYFVRNLIWPAPPAHQRVQFSESVYEAPGLSGRHAYDHVPSAGSNLIDAGAHLTRAAGSGSGRILPVEDAMYFYDGFGIHGEVGDLIAIGRSDQRARIVK